MVLVSRIGVSSSPHSTTCVSPETSPAPLSTKAPPASRSMKMLPVGGDDRRDAGAHRALPHHQRPGLASDDGGVPDQHPLHVGDGVEPAGPEAAEGEIQLTGADATLGHVPHLQRLPSRGKKPRSTALPAHKMHDLAPRLHVKHPRSDGSDPEVQRASPRELRRVDHLAEHREESLRIAGAEPPRLTEEHRPAVDEEHGRPVR